MGLTTDQAREPRPSIWRRIRSALVPRPDQDPNVKGRGFGWGWLVFIFILGIALHTVARSPLAARGMDAVILITLPFAVVIYFLLRKRFIDKGHFGGETWKGSALAGVIGLPICAFVAGLIAGLSGRALPPNPAEGGPRVGPTEAILLVLVVAVVAVPVLIAYFINKRFKRSKKDQLPDGRSAALFASPERAGKWAQGLLAVTLIMAAAASVSGILQIELLSRIARGAFYAMEEAARSDSRQQIIGILQVVLLVATAVAFLIWLHRAYKNLPSLGRKRFAFTPGWAVGFFFIPFLNLIRPFQAVRELWHGSDPGRWEPETPSDKPETQEVLATPPLIGWWWGLFLVSNIVGNIAARAYLSSSGADVRTAAVLMAVADLLDVPGALVAISLVGRLTRWQTEKARLISQRGTQFAINENPFSGAEVKKKTRENVLIVVIALLVIPAVASLFFRFPPGETQPPLGDDRQRQEDRDGNKEPQKVYVEGQYFTVGSTREEVLRIQGPPTLKMEFVWYYDDSYVQFDSDGKVNDVWNYSKNLKVKPWKMP